VRSVPADPPRAARVAGFLARLRLRAAGFLGPLGTLAVVLRRTRLLPVTLTALALGGFAVAAPLAPYDDDARSTAALSVPSGGRELLPATGDGWTQDGVPAVPWPTDEGSTSSSTSSTPSAPSPSGSPAGSAPVTASAAEEPAGDAPFGRATGSTSSSSGTSPSASSSGSSAAEPSPSASSPSPRSPSPAAAAASQASESSESPATPSQTPEVATPAADPAGQVLAAVDTARTAAGCRPLAVDAGLASLAAGHSAAVRDGGSPPDVGSRTVVVATGTDPASVAAGWLADDTLLDCGLTLAGVATTDGFWALVAA
jgi:hypothetical protein